MNIIVRKNLIYCEEVNLMYVMYNLIKPNWHVHAYLPERDFCLKNKINGS